jgi:exo-beta-1,3-glucanase (GH17 family)
MTSVANTVTIFFILLVAAFANVQAGTTQAKIDTLLQTFTPGVGKVGCIDFSPRIYPYTWDSGNQPPDSFVDQLLTILHNQTSFRCIMIYDIYENIIRIAKSKGFKVMGIVWLTLDTSDNTNAIQRAITAARDYTDGTIVGFSCGSELAFREGITSTVNSITNHCFNTIRNAGVTIPIGVIDSLKTWNQKWTIASTADFLGVNIYPWYDNTMSDPTCTTPSEAAQQTLNRFKNIQAKYTKKFILTEYGWPGDDTGKSLKFGCGIASNTYQKQVVSQIVELFRVNKYPLSVFTAFRDVSTQVASKAYKKYWGLCMGTAPYTCLSQPTPYQVPTTHAPTAKTTTRAPTTTTKKPTTHAPTTTTKKPTTHAPTTTTKKPATTVKATTTTHAPSTTKAPASCPSGWYSYNFACYKHGAEASYTSATEQCTALGATLAVVSGTAENTFLLNNVNPTDSQSVWLGYKKSGSSYLTTDGKTPTFSNWKTGEPITSQLCVTMIRDRTSSFVGKWKTEACTTARTFICKKAR